MDSISQQFGQLPIGSSLSTELDDKMRQVTLPSGLTGQLYLSPLPGGGRYPFQQDQEEIASKAIDRVVCLVPLGDLQRDSPDYYAYLKAAPPLAWNQVLHPIEDFGVPADSALFRRLAESIASGLLVGEKILIHCTGGIGRTGTLAVGVLCSLGLPRAAALTQVQAAGSHPETDAQRDLLATLWP